MALSFCEDEAAAHPDIAERYHKLADLFRRRLWHQLTEELLEFLRDDATDRGKNRVALYENFVKHVEHRINPLQLVSATVLISRQLHPSSPGNAVELSEAAWWLLERLLLRRRALAAGARAVAALEIASLRLQGAAVGGEGGGEEGSGGVPAPDHLVVDKELVEKEGGRTDGGPPFPIEEVVQSLREEDGVLACRRTLESLRGLLAELEGGGEEPIVLATFHRVAAEFHRQVGPAASFYRHILRFLSLTPLDSIEATERVAIATDLAQAALVSEEVHDLGTVATHPILEYLSASPEKGWVADLVLATQQGDVERFATAYASHEDEVAAEHEALAASLDTVKEKVALAAVVEAVARRPAADRSVPLRDIAKAAYRDDDLERDEGALSLLTQRLLMRGMSLGLIRGRIDQVEEIVHIDYVRPRVLDDAGIDRIQAQIEAWVHKVHAAAIQVEDGAAEVLA